MKTLACVLVCLFGLYGLTSVCCAQPSSQAQSRPPSSSADEQETPVYQDKDAEKFYQHLNNRLARMRRYKERDKNESDWYIIGTATVHPQTLHADVCFQTVGGQSETAQAIVDFMSRSDTGLIPRWHVFYRAEDEQKANELLVSVQNQYDQAVAYREELMRQYQARSIRRC